MSNDVFTEMELQLCIFVTGGGKRIARNHPNVFWTGPKTDSVERERRQLFAVDNTAATSCRVFKLLIGTTPCVAITRCGRSDQLSLNYAE